MYANNPHVPRAGYENLGVHCLPFEKQQIIYIICYAMKKNKGAEFPELEDNDTTSSKHTFYDASLCFSHIRPPQSSSQMTMF